jgi:fatty acid-binding protein DegV
MEKVVVVTDSTAYLPPQLVKQYGMQVAPLAVIWDGKTLHDDVDITPTEFYARLKESKSLPISRWLKVAFL